MPNSDAEEGRRAGPAWDDVRRLLERAVADGVFPGAVLLVGAGDEVVAEIAAGSVGGAAADPVDGAGSRPTGPEVIYDLASLTKPLVTVACAALLIARGRLRLDDRVADRLPEFRADDSDRAAVTLRHLLSHSSGLPAYRRYFERFDPERVLGAAPDRGGADGENVARHATGSLGVAHGSEGRASDDILALVCREPLERPAGRSSVYSDLGFILLGEVLRRAVGEELDRLFEVEFAKPLGLETARFIRTPARADVDGGAVIAPTGRCPWRRRVVRGVVQDENAYAMGGVAGHAGLFGTAVDVHRLAAEHLCALAGRGRVLDGAVVAELWRRDANVAETTTWALGWDTPTVGASSAGSLVSPDAVGHLGYTGTSLWIDRTRGVHVVLLSNRVHPDPEHQAIRAFRPTLHDAVFRAFDSLA